MHTLEERGDDAYIDPPIATTALLHIEPNLRQVLHDPACGQGNIVHTLRKAGHTVTAATSSIERENQGTTTAFGLRPNLTRM